MAWATTNEQGSVVFRLGCGTRLIVAVSASGVVCGDQVAKARNRAGNLHATRVEYGSRRVSFR